MDLQLYPDVVVAPHGCVLDNEGRDVVYLWQNDRGVLQLSDTLDLGLQSYAAPGDLAVGDFREEAWAPTPWDIACPHLWDPWASLLRNETLHPGDPWVFEVDVINEPCYDPGAGVLYSTVVSAKFGSDTHWDFAAAQYFGKKVAVFTGDGQGNFTSDCRQIVDPHDPGNDFITWGVTAGHLNGGTLPDLVVTLHNQALAAQVAVVLGKADGSFQGPDEDSSYRYDPGIPVQCPALAAIADLNQDGFGDIITTNHYSDNISVLINRLKVSPP